MDSFSQKLTLCFSLALGTLSIPGCSLSSGMMESQSLQAKQISTQAKSRLSIDDAESVTDDLSQFTQFGDASYYADYFSGNTTASGEAYDPEQLTAAHLELPFGTLLKVVNLKNNRSVVVRVNDCGPFVPGRIIDLSQRAAAKLNMLENGAVPVQIVEIIENDEQ